MPQELTNAQGQLVWQASYKTWGSTVAEEWEVKTLSGDAVHPLDAGDSPRKTEQQQQNLRFQGQYLDRDTGLHYNTFRYYDPDMGRFICPDPIGLLGGFNLGSYAPNPISWIDPLGWVAEGAEGYRVYGLYSTDPSSPYYYNPETRSGKPYYVGITDDLKQRAGEHKQTGRISAGTEMHPMTGEVTYGQARGIERAQIEHHGTNTGVNGTDMRGLPAEDLSGRGNRNLGFDVNSPTRPTGRQQYFYDAYRAAGGKIKSVLSRIKC